MREREKEREKRENETSERTALNTCSSVGQDELSVAGQRCRHDVCCFAD